MIMEKQFYHQGDVPCYPFEGQITGEKIAHNGSVTLALGEVTGHNHTIYSSRIEDMDAYKTADGGWILTLRAPATIKHQEHKDITLAPGTYRIGKEREYDWFQKAVRKVID